MLPIETTTKLLKLHLQWPDRKRYDGKDDQPLEFYKWLFVNHHDRPEVMEIQDLELVEQFLEKNKHVLWPSSNEEEKWANLRLEPRIANDVEVSMTVVKSEDEQMMGRVVTGRTLDLGLHGMRVVVSDSLPPRGIVKLGIKNASETAHTYDLQAELRWATALEDGHLIGLKLLEDEAFETWQKNFGVDFVAPTARKNRKKSR